MLATYLIYGVVTKVNSDTNVLLLPSIENVEKSHNIKALLESYAFDLNGDGKTYVNVNYIPIDTEQSDANLVMANNTKLIGEIQAGETLLFISNKECDEQLNLGEIMEDLRNDYPDNEKITEFGFKLEGEKVKKALDWEDMPEGMYIGIRNPNEINGSSKKKVKIQYDFSRKILDNLINDLS